MSNYGIVTIKRSAISKNRRLMFLGKNGNHLTVEEIALEYYESKEAGIWDGFWCERVNFFLQGAMDKHFWNIFLDYLTSKEILSNKTEILCKLIVKKMRKVYSHDLTIVRDRLNTLKTVKQNWDTFEDDKKAFIYKYNDYFQKTLRYAPIVIQALTRKQLINVASRARCDSSRRGVPDLFLFRRGKNHIDHKFVEVKSQHDKLSEHQLTWIKFLQVNRLNIEVLKVNNSPE